MSSGPEPDDPAPVLTGAGIIVAVVVAIAQQRAIQAKRRRR